MDPYTEYTDLPPTCHPASPFLITISRLFSTCIPTHLSLLSSTLGFLSITAWLFAQLPQIVKNYKSKSVDGLSLMFLLNWLMGDVCNLAGTILLQQMFFQKVIGGYYVVVDICLMGQWLFYGVLCERLRIRQAERDGYRYVEDKRGDHGGDGIDEVDVIIEGMSPPRSEAGSIYGVGIKAKKSFADAMSRYEGVGGGYSSSPPPIGTPGSSRSPMGRQTLTTMFMFVTLFALALGYPDSSGGQMHMNRRRISVSPFGGSVIGYRLDRRGGPATSGSDGGEWFDRDLVGIVIAWVSTALYCSSRLPQLHKNYTRRSCAGLSITLFIAAFFGNVFYSLSLFTNPLGWSDYPPYGGGGLAGPEGSLKKEWWGNALPFFLGAAGVLCQDAAIFVQFVLWGEREPEEEQVQEVVIPGAWGWKRFIPTMPKTLLSVTLPSVSWDVVRVDRSSRSKAKAKSRALLRDVLDENGGVVVVVGKPVVSYGTL